MEKQLLKAGSRLRRKMNKLSARGVFTVVVIMYILAELIAGLIEKLL